MRRYPGWTDFASDDTCYGVSAPCGIGIYTLDRAYCWPDPEASTDVELLAWADKLKSDGYLVPRSYESLIENVKGEGK